MPQLAKNTQTSLSEINMVPFIDVVLVLLIDKAQRVYLGNDPVNIHQLPAKIKAQLKGPQDSVFLRCDETVPFGSFATVVDELRQSGIANISIVTEPITTRARTQ